MSEKEKKMLWFKVLLSDQGLIDNDLLTDTDRSCIFRNMFRFCMDQELLPMSQTGNLVFLQFKARIEDCQKDYIEICKRNKRNRTGIDET